MTHQDKDFSCEGGAWSYKPRSKLTTEAKTEEGAPLLGDKEDKFVQDDDAMSDESVRAFYCSLCTLVLSIPAIIGGWCWPSILVPMIGWSVSAVSRTLSHIFTFAVTLLTMAGVCIYTGYSNKSRGKGMTDVWLCVASSVLIMADPTRNLLADAEIWPSPASDMYSCEAETFDCLTRVGAATIFFTYVGFTLLAIGTLWSAELGQKWRLIKRKWRAMNKPKVVEDTSNQQDQEDVSRESDRLLGETQV